MKTFTIKTIALSFAFCLFLFLGLAKKLSSTKDCINDYQHCTSIAGTTLTAASKRCDSAYWLWWAKCQNEISLQYYQDVKECGSTLLVCLSVEN